MGSDQNNKKPIEVDLWVVENLGRVVRHIESIENIGKRAPQWAWELEDITISEICQRLQGYILTPKGEQLLHQIAELEADKARQYTNGYPGIKAICDLVEFARRRTTKPEELEINQVAPLDKTPRAEKYFKRAVELGYMVKRAPCGEGYKWIWGGNRGAKARLAYFLERVFCPKPTDKIRGADRKWLEKHFVVTRLDRAFDQNADAGRSESVREWREKIEIDIFFD